jgi:TolB-like protein/class 3 adenylate cyclase
MVEDPVKRRLAAILAADVVGYSRLMGEDEAGTLAALKARRKNVLEPIVARHRGRIFKLTGDGVLVEFASAVNAVECAVELQQAMAAANDGCPEDRHVVLRIGINLGDVIIEGHDLYGDGVNLAARLERIAVPGGIVVSSMVRDQIGNRLDLKFADLGEQSLKNIEKPIRAYSVQPGGGVKGASQHTRVSGKPSIAVLAFTNMSGDQDQQYLSDGITEDIITELSRFHSLLVIARNSSFQFRGQAVDIAEVQRKLGARYVVEGSLRKLGDRIRINAQLIDAQTGAHLWAERYDRSLKDIFILQDDVVASIVSMVEGHAAAISAGQTKKKPLNDWAAYDYYLRGREHFARYELSKSEPLFARCIEIDPTFAQGHAFLAQALVGKYWYDDKIGTLMEAKEAAQKGLSLDKSDAVCHQSMGLVLLHLGQHAEAGISFDRARVLNPIDVNIMGELRELAELRWTAE